MSDHEPAFDLPGLSEQVEVLVDEYGVPHLYAAGLDDLFAAQGFTAARDRLFQMDLWRRRGLGLLSEVFGRDYLERDRAARLFLYRGDMAPEWQAYGPQTQRITAAFVRGINTYVDLCREQPRHLPPEFAELDYEPAQWDPSDVARIRSHGLYSNLEHEVARARVLRDFGPQVEELRRAREPWAPLRVPEGLDLAAVPDDVLDVYRLATTPVVYGGEGRRPGPRLTPEGSNNWVVSGERSATGRPLLANDPHRAVSLPSLRYLCHLSAPGLDLIGAGEPVLPGVSIGHNGRIAFGLTIFPIDQEDLYVYETDPDDPGRYRYGDGHEAMTEVVEQVPVRDGDPVPVTLRFTRHGPVVHEDRERHTACVVRAAWLGPGMAPYLGSMSYAGAGTPDEFVAALDRWGSPGENQVYAAPDGTIGWRPAGRVPVRRGWDGTLPVPGDGRFEWDGFLDGRELPAVRDPEQGWFATANQMNLPTDYPNGQRTITYDWYHPYRHDRIAEVLGGREGWTVADCVQLQCDYLSVPARQILPVLSGLHSPESRVDGALRLLRDWDAVESPDSAAAALFEVWYHRHLRPTLLTAALRELVPAGDVAAALSLVLPPADASFDARVDLSLLLEPGERLGPDPEGTIAEVVLASLGDAVAEVEQRLGPEPSTWRWGDLHRALLTHPLRALLPPGHEWTQVGPLPRGGSGDTVGSTGYYDGFDQRSGASFRMVVDVGDWDRSVAMNAPGQSGVPTSPHHADLFERWAADEAFPLLYTRAAVEEHLSERFVLRPPG
jgi:penicillin amidase